MTIIALHFSTKGTDKRQTCACESIYTVFERITNNRAFELNQNRYSCTQVSSFSFRFENKKLNARNKTYFIRGGREFIRHALIFSEYTAQLLARDNRRSINVKLGIIIFGVKTGLVKLNKCQRDRNVRTAVLSNTVQLSYNADLRFRAAMLLEKGEKKIRRRENAGEMYTLLHLFMNRVYSLRGRLENKIRPHMTQVYCGVR
jgi:hypothetical protein